MKLKEKSFLWEHVWLLFLRRWYSCDEEEQNTKTGALFIGHKLSKSPSLIGTSWGTWEAQLVRRLTSAHVMTSRFMGSSPASGSVLTGQILCLLLSAPPPSKINKH